MDDFDVEVQDEKQSNPEHINGNVATAGSSQTITPSSGNKIQLAYIKNPNKGPNANGFQDVLLVSIDGSTNYTVISRGEYTFFPGVFDSIKIDTNNDGTKYEIIIWS